ncbi:Apoptosis inhibitor 5 [Eumeta japonica]|uniref:Apoptosis inhibitor 5 n=1 Tax=Eumeta variegata TaxID=151549 RepID=A0A4C1SS14_EUMVA|nr:Apoptosis inhibitor 5 [Eumeta japonica]
MTSDNIEKLYQNYGILADAKDDISKHEKEYLEILAAVKGSDKEKRLASQFIAKFFNSFPNLADQAIEAQFDLCEDEDVAIRKQAIKDLPSLCKERKEHTHKIADILAQILQSEDPTEINIVSNSLLTVLKNDPKSALSGIFSQTHQGTDSEVVNEVVRERCIKFLASKVKQLGREVINKEAEDLIIAECKKILEDVVAEEFEHIMDLLTWSRLGKTPAGKKELVTLVAALAFSPDDWHPNDPEYVDRIIQCSMHALPLFSAQVESTQFVNFFCEHVLPRWNDIASPDGTTTDTKLELLKIFAEITEHCGELEKPEEKISTVYNLLMEYLPEAPIENSENPDSESTPSEIKNDESKSVPSLQFSHVECTLFALHSLCRRSPEALSSDTTRLKALRLRLQYTARLTQGYIKKLKEVTQRKKGADAETEENKLKIAALKTTSNINTLIRDLFRVPPSFKSRVQLSFQTKKNDKDDKFADKFEDNINVTSGQKRHQPITFDNGDEKVSPQKRSKSGDRNLKMYTPPSGKYSSRLSSGARFVGPNSGRFRGGYAEFLADYDKEIFKKSVLLFERLATQVTMGDGDRLLAGSPHTHLPLKKNPLKDVR